MERGWGRGRAESGLGKRRRERVGIVEGIFTIIIGLYKAAKRIQLPLGGPRARPRNLKAETIAPAISQELSREIPRELRLEAACLQVYALF